MLNDSKTRVAVIYDAFPHYRKGIIEELAMSDKYEYYFFGNPAYRDNSIEAYYFKPGMRFVPTHSMSWRHFNIQANILSNVFKKGISHCIFLGNPWFLSYWVLTPLLRLFGKKVYFWSHGWISKDEPRLRGTIKRLFFRLPNALLLYGRRSKQIGTTHRFKSQRMHVINNSLDYPNQKILLRDLAGCSVEQVREEFSIPLDHKVIICTARVTKKCRFDLLLHAVKALQTTNRDFFVVVVGDGPERETLSTLAVSLGVRHQFRGACYDEVTLAKLYKAADLTVSPGKVGLTAMHSMGYGTPVISHGNFDHQMPESETIVPGVTGDFFAENSVDDLARVILKWFEEHPSKPERACIERVEAEFTPAFQRLAIESALELQGP